MEARVQALVEKNGPGPGQRLKQRLSAMAKRDQAVRSPKYVFGSATPQLVKERQRTAHRRRKRMADD